MSRLVVSRKPGQSFDINHDIKVTIVSNRGNVVRIAIDAPEIYVIKRSELTPLLPVNGVTATQHEHRVEDLGSATRPPKSIRERMKRNGGVR